MKGDKGLYFLRFFISGQEEGDSRHEILSKLGKEKNAAPLCLAVERL